MLPSLDWKLLEVERMSFFVSVYLEHSALYTVGKKSKSLVNQNSWGIAIQCN